MTHGEWAVIAWLVCGIVGVNLGFRCDGVMKRPFVPEKVWCVLCGPGVLIATLLLSLMLAFGKEPVE